MTKLEYDKLGNKNSTKILILIFSLLFIFIFFDPLVLLLINVLAFCLSSLNSRFKNFNVSASLLLSTFYWFYLLIVINVHSTDLSTFTPLIKGFICIPIFFIIFIENLRLLQSCKKIFSGFVVIFVLLMFSLIKGRDNLAVSINYLGNLYLPLFILLLLSFALLKRVKTIGVSKQFTSCNSLLVVVYSVMVLNLCMLLLYLLGIDYSGYNSEIGHIMGREGGSVGNIRTRLFGVNLPRFSGIFFDPTVAAYILNFFFCIILLFDNNVVRKLITLCIVVVFGLLTLSKSFWLLSLSSLFFAFIYLFKKRLRFFLFWSYSTSILVVLIVRALSDSTLDSSAIHVLGLVSPFIDYSGFSYFIGADLGSGGNLGGWVEQGAESSIGVFQYHLGLVGVFSIFSLFYFLLSDALSYKDKVSKLITISIFPVLLASFLQENSFNLATSNIKILFFYILLSKLKNIQSRVND
jgi:hypothetical protein